jgi:hypothetical protein
MMHILAQIGETVLQTGGGVAVGGAGLYALQQILKRRVHLDLDLGGEPNGKTKPCSLHEPLVKLLDERHAQVRGDLSEIKTAVNEGFCRVHERIDKILKPGGD